MYKLSPTNRSISSKLPVILTVCLPWMNNRYIPLHKSNETFRGGGGYCTAPWAAELNVPVCGVSEYANDSGLGCDVMNLISHDVFWFTLFGVCRIPLPILIVPQCTCTAITYITDSTVQLQCVHKFYGMFFFCKYLRNRRS